MNSILTLSTDLTVVQFRSMTLYTTLYTLYTAQTSLNITRNVSVIKYRNDTTYQMCTVDEIRESSDKLQDTSLMSRVSLHETRVSRHETRVSRHESRV